MLDQNNQTTDMPLAEPFESVVEGGLNFNVMESDEDASINWIAKTSAPGFVEARYVRRVKKYFALYLSSQTGCGQACRMCHLTATGQNKYEDVSISEYLDQARVVLDHYAQHKETAEVVHFNFMARGEPFTNEALLRSGDELLLALAQEAQKHALLPRHLISTILPKSLDGRALTDIFKTTQPDIYYSLYSVDPSFRRRWLPNALTPREGLSMLHDWQRHTNKIPKIHYAFIKDENDSEADVQAVCDAINEQKLRVNVNIVRYNPMSDRQGQETSDEIVERNAAIFAENLPHARVKVIQRVGFDVYASCGMFVS